MKYILIEYLTYIDFQSILSGFLWNFDSQGGENPAKRAIHYPSCKHKTLHSYNVCSL